MASPQWDLSTGQHATDICLGCAYGSGVAGNIRNVEKVRA